MSVRYVSGYRVECDNCKTQCPNIYGLHFEALAMAEQDGWHNTGTDTNPEHRLCPDCAPKENTK